MKYATLLSAAALALAFGASAGASVKRVSSQLAPEPVQASRQTEECPSKKSGHIAQASKVGKKVARTRTLRTADGKGGVR